MSVRWTAPERAWRDALLAAALPGHGRPLPEAAWAAWAAAASLPLAWGFRATVWVLTWWPLLTHGRPLHRLPPAAREAVLERVAGRDDLLSVQLVTALKVVAGLATQVPR